MKTNKSPLNNLVVMIIKNQERFRRNLSLKDQWWIIQNGECAVNLFALSILEREALEKVEGIRYTDWLSKKKEKIVWRKPPKVKRGSSIHLSEVMSQFVLHQEAFKCLSTEQINSAIKRPASTINFYFEVLLNREIITSVEFKEEVLKDWKGRLNNKDGNGFLNHFKVF